MDLNDWQTKDGTNILAYEPHGRDNQKFVFNTPKAKQTTWVWPLLGTSKKNVALRFKNFLMVKDIKGLILLVRKQSLLRVMEQLFG